MSIFNRYTLAFLAIVAFSFSACDNDDEKPKGKFQTGVFVVNEGNYNSANGTISHFDLSTKETTQDVFGIVNSGKALGDVVQSLTIDHDDAYIVVNNSNKIEVVDANTFEGKYTISTLDMPRYFTTFNGMGYVTEWVNFVSPGQVSLIDLQTHEVIDSVATDYGSERIIVVNDKLYVSNNFTNTVSVIDPTTLSVLKTIEVGSSPAGFAVDSEDKLWVVCQGGFDENYNPLNDGQVVRIDPVSNSVLKSINLNSNISSGLASNNAGTYLYYFTGSSVYRLDIDAEEPPASPFINRAAEFYALGVDPKTDVIYVSDAENFAASGTVYRYNSDGTELDSFTAGIGPNEFVFKY